MVNTNKNYNNNNKTTNNQVMHNAIAHHHCSSPLLTDSRPSFLNSGWTPLLGNSLSLYNGLDVLWCEISVWSVQVTCPSCALFCDLFTLPVNR